LFGPSGLTVVSQGLGAARRVVESSGSLESLASGAGIEPRQVESIMVQPIARTGLRKPPPDVAVVSVFRKRSRMTAWMGLATEPSNSAVIHLHGHSADAVADRLALAIGQDQQGGPFAWAGGACPACAAPARLPSDDVSKHPAWCTLSSSWTCDRCRTTLSQGSVLARGQSDGDVRGPGPINVLLEVVYLFLQIIAAFVLVVAVIRFIMLIGDFNWGDLLGGAAMGAASVALLLWFGFRGPIWRLPLLKASPCRARHVCDLAVCVAPGTVEIRRARGFRNARWRRFSWARPAGLHVAHHPEGPLLISPFENSFRLWAFLPSDPRGYRATELAEALRRAYGDGAERSA